jgi:hypothetical protein
LGTIGKHDPHSLSFSYADLVEGGGQVLGPPGKLPVFDPFALKDDRVQVGEIPGRIVQHLIQGDPGIFDMMGHAFLIKLQPRSIHGFLSKNCALRNANWELKTNQNATAAI